VDKNEDTISYINGCVKERSMYANRIIASKNDKIMKTRQLKSTHNNKLSVACLLKFLFILLIFSLVIGVTHGFAKTISGHVRNSIGIGMNGVTLSFSNNAGSTITDSSGYYIRGIPNSWSGTVTPTKDGYGFDPKSRSYSNVTSNLSNQDYTADTGSDDGNNDGMPDSPQNNLSYLVLDNSTNYVAMETPRGTSIKNFKAVVDPPNSNYPSDVEYPYGFFSFAVEGIGVGGSTLVTLYFPSGYTFNTYYRYGPTPDNPFNHWYEFVFDGRTGAEINENIITLNFVDGMRGDDDLTENGIIVDLGGPGIKAITPSEFDSESDGGGADNYGCFVGCML
jgi:hypothetical protein